MFHLGPLKSISIRQTSLIYTPLYLRSLIYFIWDLSSLQETLKGDSKADLKRHCPLKQVWLQKQNPLCQAFQGILIEVELYAGVTGACLRISL